MQRGFLIALLFALVTSFCLAGCDVLNQPTTKVTVSSHGFSPKEVDQYTGRVNTDPVQFYNQTDQEITLCFLQSGHCDSSSHWGDYNYGDPIRLPARLKLEPHKASAPIWFDDGDYQVVQQNNLQYVFTVTANSGGGGSGG